MPKLGFCAYCQTFQPLCQSHAIPNSFFKRILRRSGGNYIDISTFKLKIHRSGDSGKALLLCASCEDLFNKRFDKHGVNCILEMRQKLLSDVRVRRLQLNHNIMAQFLLSVVWRASVSTAIAYHDFNLPREVEKITRINLREGANPLNLISIRVLNLIDYTNDGFTQEHLSELIAGPFFARGERKGKPIHAVIMIFSGFAFFLFFPRVSPTVRSSPGYLKKNCQTIFLNDIDIFKIPMMIHLFMTAFDKNEKGLKTF